MARQSQREAQKKQWREVKEKQKADNEAAQERALFEMSVIQMAAENTANTTETIPQELSPVNARNVYVGA